jgi:hypothetical protein
VVKKTDTQKAIEQLEAKRDAIQATIDVLKELQRSSTMRKTRPAKPTKTLAEFVAQ